MDYLSFGCLVSIPLERELRAKRFPEVSKISHSKIDKS
jgi:hypothetical protein